VRRRSKETHGGEKERDRERERGGGREKGEKESDRKKHFQSYLCGLEVAALSCDSFLLKDNKTDHMPWEHTTLLHHCTDLCGPQVSVPGSDSYVLGGAGLLPQAVSSHKANTKGKES
jgi:hypothetical protein